MKHWNLICTALAVGFVCAGIAGATNAAGAAPAPAAAKPIATTDGEAPGTRIEVQELKRIGTDALMLKFAVHNDSETAIDNNTFYGNHGGSVDGVYLVDLDGKKKYYVVTDADKQCVCSQGISAIAPHTRIVLWAKFPAPPDSVTKIGVVMPHFVPMDDVPISH